MDGPALEQASSDDRCSTGFNSDGSQIFPVLDILVVSAAGSQAIDAVFRQPDVGYLCLAQPGGRLHKCVEHRLQIECRAADDLENAETKTFDRKQAASAWLARRETELRERLAKGLPP